MIKDILDAYIVPKIWQHDRTKTIGSSEVGQCIRRTWYTKREWKPDDDYKMRWGATERGNMFENYLWEPALRKKFGKNLLFAGKEQLTFVDGELSATPDGLLINQPRSILKHLGVPDIGSKALSVECKTIDPRVSLTEAKHTNWMQVQVAMGAIRSKGQFFPQYALISYANASFLDDITEFAVPFEQNIYDAAKVRAATIYNAKDAKELRPEGFIEGGKECEHCPFLKSCGIERHNLPSAKFVPATIDPQLKAEFVDLVRLANSEKHFGEEYTARYKETCEEIKERLREKNIRSIPGVLKWTDVKGRGSYDMPALTAAAAKAGIDIEIYSKTGEATSRLTLEEIADDESAMTAPAFRRKQKRK